MATPLQGRQVAVVPRTEGTLHLAEKLARRCVSAGIEIALVDRRGEVFSSIAKIPGPWLSGEQLVVSREVVEPGTKSIEGPTENRDD